MDTIHRRSEVERGRSLVSQSPPKKKKKMTTLPEGITPIFLKSKSAAVVLARLFHHAAPSASLGRPPSPDLQTKVQKIVASSIQAEMQKFF